MKINMQNYEEYFVRLIDNELSVEETNEVNLFLQQHNELRAELEAYKVSVLEPDVSLQFPGKHLLEKGITISNYEEYFIRTVENDLSPAEVNEVNSFLAEHPELQQQMLAFKSAILVADTAIIFPDKESLKKRDGRIVPMYARYILTAAVAASLLVIFFMKGIEWNRSRDIPSVADNGNETYQDRTSVSDQSTYAQSSDSTELNNNKSINNRIADIQSGNAVAVKSSESKGNKKEKSPGQEGNAKPAIFLASDIKPMQVDDLNGISYQRRQVRAPYLVLVYDNEKEESPVANNSRSSTGVSWLSLASVVGSELLRLTGRGELVKPLAADTSEQYKPKETLAISIQSEKFSFYHKFLKKDKSSTPKKDRL